MFSQTAEYALRAMVVLADRHREPQTAQYIAAATEVPLDYLFKVMQSLARAGLVSAQRGKHGGFTLTRHPDRITILDVVNAVDPIRRIRTCPLHLDAHSRRLCALHRKLDSAMRMVEQTFASSTLAEMLKGPARKRPLCGGLVQPHAHA